MHSSHRSCARITLALVIAVASVGVVSGALVLSGDPISTAGRSQVESGLNSYLEGARLRAASGDLGSADILLLHAGIVVGSVVGAFISPEGGAILWHAVHGDGSELRLDPKYFRQSRYLAVQIQTMGGGEHGPIWIPQAADWRLSLAFNPIYLVVNPHTIRVGHPNIRFAGPRDAPTFTVVPIGRFRLRVPDNLVGALQPIQFATWAEWELGVGADRSGVVYP